METCMILSSLVIRKYLQVHVEHDYIFQVKDLQSQSLNYPRCA